MENIVQKCVPNEPLQGEPEPYEEIEETEVPSSEGNDIVIEGGDDEEIIEEGPNILKAVKGKRSNISNKKHGVKGTTKSVTKPGAKTTTKPVAKQTTKPATKQQTSSFTGNNFQLEALNKHNELRNLHHVDNLVLDKELCDIAQKYANKLAANDIFEHSKNNFKGKPMGENLYCCYGMDCTGNEMTQAWYDEIKDYNFNKPGWKTGTGHFTQVVWVSTKEVGFGFAKASDNSYYAVGNYYPAGNIVNPGFFEENVLPIQ